MRSESQSELFACLEAICSGDKDRAAAFLEQLEFKAFVEGADKEHCIKRCRETVDDPEQQSMSALIALDECAFAPREKIKLLLLGLANSSLDVLGAAQRLAEFFPGHDLQDEDRVIVELAYQLDHDRQDQLSDSFAELVSEVRAGNLGGQPLG